MQKKFEKGERETIGSLSQQLLAKEQDTDDAIELQREIQGDSYETELLEAVDRAKKKYHTNFYIVVLNQKFRLFPNAMRSYFIDRLSCPTPDYDQTVYRFDRKDDAIDFMWTIPDQETCAWLKDNALTIDPEYRELLQFVLDMYDGTLLQIAKKLNKEEEQDLILKSLGEAHG